jgi:hypothetical protein
MDNISIPHYHERNRRTCRNEVSWHVLIQTSVNVEADRRATDRPSCARNAGTGLVCGLAILIAVLYHACFRQRSDDFLNSANARKEEVGIEKKLHAAITGCSTETKCFAGPIWNDHGYRLFIRLMGILESVQ